MIKTQYLVPEVYYDKSRDFQYLGRIFDIVFNSLKVNSSLIYSNPLSKNMDKKLLDLLSLTLGLKLKHNYNLEQLYTVCTVFEKALKNKGNITSIQLIVDALLKIQKVNAEAQILYDKYNHILEIYLPSSLQDNQLFNDLLDYVLPAGIICNVYTYIGVNNDASTLLYQSDNIKSEYKVSKSTSYVPKYSDIIGTETSTTNISNLKFGGRNENSVIVPYTNPTSNGSNEESSPSHSGPIPH